MAAFLDLAMARIPWIKDQAAFASKIKLIGQQAVEGLDELNLESLRYLKKDVQEIVAMASSFLMDRHELSAVMVFKKFGIPPDTPRAAKRVGCPPYVSALVSIVTSEASTLFRQSEGWKKFSVYKSVEVASENLWNLGGLIGWDEAAFLGTALQASLTTIDGFTVSVRGELNSDTCATKPSGACKPTPKATQPTPVNDDDDSEWDMGSSD